MELTMKKMMVGALAASALASGASAATTYSAMGTTNALTVTTMLDGTVCAAGNTIKAGTGVLTVKATGFDTSSSDSTAVVKICYEAAQTVGRKWRKKNDVVDKNKQCKQTAVESDQLAKGVAVSDLTRTAGFDIQMPLNIAPNNYYIQVLEKSASNGYLRYGNSACTFTVDTYERTPQGLVGTMSFFIAFSIIVSTAGIWYDHKKQNAAASAYA